MAGKKLILFGENGDSIADAQGSLWDLLANVGDLAEAADGGNLVVGFMDGELVRAMPLATAITKEFTPEKRAELATKLRRRGLGYHRVAKWINAMDVPAEEGPPVEEPIEGVASEIERAP